MQLQQQVTSMSAEIHQLQVVTAEAKTTAVEGTWSGGQLRSQLSSLVDKVAR